MNMGLRLEVWVDLAFWNTMFHILLLLQAHIYIYDVMLDSCRAKVHFTGVHLASCED
jgi:hypothetical protein